MNTTRRTSLILVLAAVSAVARAQQQGRRAAEPAAAADSAQQPAAGPRTLDEAWTAAKAMMRSQQAPGLVFVLPPAAQPADAVAAQKAVSGFQSKLMGQLPVQTATARDVLLLQIQLLRQIAQGGTEGADRRLPLGAAFALAVPIVATAATCGAEDGETLVLLGVDGVRTRGFRVDLGDPAAVDAALRPVLFDAERLRARAANVPPPLLRAIDVLRAPANPEANEADQARRAAAIAALQRDLYAAAPALAAAVDLPPVEPMGRGNASGTPLAWLLQWTTPLGTEVATTWDPCPPCGMMAMPMPMRSALKLLAQ